MDATRTPIVSRLQPFLKALANQNLDIDPPVEFTADSVRVVGKPMRAAITNGHKNASHWDVLNLIEITSYSRSAFLAQLLIRFAAQCVGGVSEISIRYP